MRFRYTAYWTADIALFCLRGIADLKAILLTEQIYRELHVREPDRRWHRYLVLHGTTEVIEEIATE